MAEPDYAELYYRSYLAGMQNGNDLSGVETPDVLPEDADQSLRKQSRRSAAKLEKDILDSPEAKERIISLRDAWQNSGDVLSLADLRAAYNSEFGTMRALRIARTEVQQSFEAANAAAIQAAGFDSMEWNAAADACPYCASLDGQVMSVADFLKLIADEHPNGSCTGLPSDAPEGSDFAVENPFPNADDALEREAPDLE